MNNELEIGKIYDVSHDLKGNFSMKISSVSGEWVTGTITAGTAKTQTQGDGQPGDIITIRKSLARFTIKKADL